MIEAPFLFLLLQAASPPSPPDTSTKAGVEAEARLFFSTLDANHDGKVDRAEAEAYHAKAVAFADRLRREANTTFDRLDANKDGMLSRQEYLAIIGSPPPAKEAWFDANDANRDGRVELSEAIRRVLVTFDALDTNHDGKLSAQEMAAARAGK